jgi:hypothetical protein
VAIATLHWLEEMKATLLASAYQNRRHPKWIIFIAKIASKSHFLRYAGAFRSFRQMNARVLNRNGQGSHPSPNQLMGLGFKGCI